MTDSSVWIDYFNGIRNQQTDLLDELLYDGQAIILDIILAEVLQGFRTQRDFNTARTLLDPLPCYASLSGHLAVQSAIYFRQLKKKGVTVRKTIDMIIATWCIEHNAALLENDKDFLQMQDVIPLNLVRQEA